MVLESFGEVWDFFHTLAWRTLLFPYQYGPG